MFLIIPQNAKDEYTYIEINGIKTTFISATGSFL